MLPHWPPGTVAILSTAGAAPHAIPVSNAVRADSQRILMALASRRESLARLRNHPEVSLTVLYEGEAFTADGRARVMKDPLVDGVVAVEIEVDRVHDHRQPTFELQSGVRWRWTDPDAARRDADVRSALEALAGRPGEPPPPGSL